MTPSGLRVDQSIDTRGRPSPESYQQAIERLRQMTENNILELYIDDGAALETIPFGLRAEGHEILVSEPAQRGIRLLVRKRSALP